MTCRIRWLCGLVVAALCFAVFAPAVEARPLRMTLKERRELGLTLVQLVQTARELDQAGELDRENHDVAAGQLLVAAQAKNAKARTCGPESAAA